MMNNSVDNKDIATVETKKNCEHYNLNCKYIVSIAIKAIAISRVKLMVDTNDVELIKVNV